MIYLISGLILPAFAMIAIIHCLNPTPPKTHSQYKKQTYPK